MALYHLPSIIMIGIYLVSRYTYLFYLLLFLFCFFVHFLLLYYIMQHATDDEARNEEESSIYCGASCIFIASVSGTQPYHRYLEW